LAFFIAAICDAFDEAYVNYVYALFAAMKITEKSILIGLKSAAWVAITISFCGQWWRS
jgi:hypothetical protein